MPFLLPPTFLTCSNYHGYCTFRSPEVLLQCLASIPFTLWLGLHLMREKRTPSPKPWMTEQPAWVKHSDVSARQLCGALFVLSPTLLRYPVPALSRCAPPKVLSIRVTLQKRIVNPYNPLLAHTVITSCMLDYAASYWAFRVFVSH